jgi:hypothetical protein
MDYEARFAFHIFFPIYVYVVYVASTYQYLSIKIPFKHNLLKNIDATSLIKIVLIFYLGVFGLKSGIRAVSLFNAYPRALEAHAALGKAIKKIADLDYSKSIVIGDAGMAAYHSDANVLDTVGLASTMIAKNGLNDKVLDAYNPSVIAFYATPSEIDLNLFGQKKIYNWALSSGFHYQCDIYWRPDYTLKIYSQSKNSILNDVCEHSRLLNDKTEQIFFNDNLLKRPWDYWKE